jgi:predicted molibdopterin-dependent oxidoreductase YjgC
MGRFHRLGETDRAPVRIEIDGASVLALAGDTLQVAILTHAGSLRRNEFDGGPRAGFCLMAACQDCLVWTVAGEQLRSCSTEVEEGMRIVTRGPAWQIEP